MCVPPAEPDRIPLSTSAAEGGAGGPSAAASSSSAGSNLCGFFCGGCWWLLCSCCYFCCCCCCCCRSWGACGHSAAERSSFLLGRAFHLWRLGGFGLETRHRERARRAMTRADLFSRRFLFLEWRSILGGRSNSVSNPDSASQKSWDSSRSISSALSVSWGASRLRVGDGLGVGRSVTGGGVGGVCGGGGVCCAWMGQHRSRTHRVLGGWVGRSVSPAWVGG